MARVSAAVASADVPLFARARRSGNFSAGVRVAILSVWAVYFVIPVYWLFIASTKSTGDVFGTQPLWFAHWQFFTNLKDAFTYQGGIFWHWCLSSLLYSGGGAAVSTFVAAIAGYYLAISDFRGREAAFYTVIGGMLIPSSALALPLFLLFSRANLTSTVWAVLLPSFVSPFSLYLCRISAEAAVPREIVEAARMSGASEARIFFTFAWRLMLPGLVTSFLTQFVSIWNNFLLPLVMLQNQRIYPLTVGLDIWQGTANAFPYLQQIVLVGSLVSIVPLVAAFLWLQRFWKSGLSTGSIKG
jgi:multiple sugar transport system permease protein